MAVPAKVGKVRHGVVVLCLAGYNFMVCVIFSWLGCDFLMH